jgi:hypothetical protein
MQSIGLIQYPGSMALDDGRLNLGAWRVAAGFRSQLENNHNKHEIFLATIKVVHVVCM